SLRLRMMLYVGLSVVMIVFVSQILRMHATNEALSRRLGLCLDHENSTGTPQNETRFPPNADCYQERRHHKLCRDRQTGPEGFCRRFVACCRFLTDGRPRPAAAVRRRAR